MSASVGMKGILSAGLYFGGSHGQVLIVDWVLYDNKRRGECRKYSVGDTLKMMREAGYPSFRVDELEPGLVLVTAGIGDAQKLTRTADKGDYVFVTTGFSIPPINIAETDGPLGAAVLTQTLRAIGLKPVLVTDDLCSEVVKAANPKKRVIKVPVDAEQARLMRNPSEGELKV